MQHLDELSANLSFVCPSTQPQIAPSYNDDSSVNSCITVMSQQILTPVPNAKTEYVVIVGLIFILEMILLVLVLAYKNVLYNKVKENLRSMIVFYRDDADLQSVIDWIQDDWLQCCGLAGPDDWDANLYFNCSSPSREACGVPHSCCITQKTESLKNLQCGYDTRKQSDSEVTIYNKGCLEKLELWLGENQIPLVIASSSILIVQISTVSLGLLLYKDIQAQLKKWEETRCQTQDDVSF